LKLDDIKDLLNEPVVELKVKNYHSLVSS